MKLILAGELGIFRANELIYLLFFLRGSGQVTPGMPNNSNNSRKVYDIILIFRIHRRNRSIQFF